MWWCGDYDCDCTEARIVAIDGYERTLVWEGEFRSEGEPGATTELNRVAQLLRRHHHDVYRRISWPWDRKGVSGGR